MEQFYTHYKNWEDYQNGMYSNKIENIDLLVDAAKKILGCKIESFKGMTRVVNEWPISCKVNFTNNGINQRAWLGQAACCIEYGVPEHLTRMAWKELNDTQRITANKVADQVISKWKSNHGNQLKLF